MPYEVLYRKWRPKTFAELVGQEHIRKALEYALEHDRLHHAYLFTGTRGVGKTTIARILARCLNCEVGISAAPCGICATCEEVLAGRFVDLIEVDAASRTRIEDTRELLDNVQYPPVRGRYKVYLIDEVHMLSASSFNALLKTLEEPPPRVVFLLATTEPKKLPITVLSRCLQFGLKSYLPEHITDHLQRIMTAEGIAAEDAALRLIARAAKGSMRDALSLTDQAIAHGGGALTQVSVHELLGTVDRHELERLANALTDQDRAALLAVCGDLASADVNYADLLQRLAELWHDVAMCQSGVAVEADDPDGAALVRSLGGRLSDEQVQLFYQIAIIGNRDIVLAPDFRIGFEMAMLRMLAFAPALAGDGASPGTGPMSGAGDRGPHASAERASRTRESAVSTAPHQRRSAATLLSPTQSPARAPVAATLSKSASHVVASEAPAIAGKAATVASQSAGAVRPSQSLLDWALLLETLPLAAMAREVALHCVPVDMQDARWEMVLDESRAALYGDHHRRTIEAALQAHFGREIALQLTSGVPPEPTPAMRIERLRSARQAEAVAQLRGDERVLALMQQFDARLDESSVRPA